MAKLLVPNAYVKGDAFRQIVRRAILTWTRAWPDEVVQYKKFCKDRRSQLTDSAAHWKGDKDIVELFRDPPRVKELIGAIVKNHRWFLDDPELETIYMDEIRDGFISSMRGGTSAG